MKMDRKALIRSIASSTAIETGESVEKIERRLWMNEELPPCPFCGCEVKLVDKTEYEYYTQRAEVWDIMCGTKGCYLEDGADYWEDDLALLITKWKTRA